MQKTSSGIVFSATDIANFVDCEHRITLDLRDLEEKLKRSPEGEMTQLLQALGMTHEKAYLETLKTQDLEVVDINQVPEAADRYLATVEAMKKGVPIIYQAALGSGQFRGYADFVRRVETPSALGKWSYEVLDTKLSLSSKGRYLIQLALYSELVGAIQGRLPHDIAVILGDGSEDRYRVSDYIHYFRVLKRRFLARIGDPTTVTYPHPCDACDDCRWKDLCEERRLVDDHLSQVAGITGLQIKRLYAVGVSTLKDLGTIPEGDPPFRIKIQKETLNRLRHQARLQYQSRLEGKRVFEKIGMKDGKDEGARGFERMPAPDQGDLFFDMEGDPMEVGGLEYLFGLAWIEEGQPVFRSFWAHDRDEEKKSFQDFMDFVTNHLKMHPNAHIYHYASYEKTALQKLMSFHATREIEVDDLLRNRKLVDLYKVVREAIRVSEPKYSIKNIEHFYMDDRAGAVTSAASSVVMYEKWKIQKDAGILKDIEEYNRVDLVSTWKLREWLRELGGDAVGSRDRKDEDEKPEKPKSDKVIQAETRVEEYRKILTGSLPADRTKWGVAEHVSELLLHLLDFHRREAKPQWWGLFERQGMTVEERLDDPQCIAAGALIGHRTASTGKSIEYTYRFMEQETKIKTGDKCVDADTLAALGNVLVDFDRLEYMIKLGIKRNAPPDALDIGEGGPISTDVLKEAVFKYADSYIASLSGSEPKYRAITAFLGREIPSITGKSAGQSLVDDSLDSSGVLSGTIEAIRNMDHSHLFIQGPPGAGKTYTGSHVIIELIRLGKKVGVTSNSHKAVNNLLKAVEAVAKEKEVPFSGSKKSNADDESGHFKGEKIKDYFDNKAIISNITIGGHLLIAGTAWLFSDPGLDQSLDYLFIDEAGQISLANLVAMGTSAKNIVLLGDQMQLGQPIQGVHPGQSGQSALDYLLQGQATIPPERGIFLGTTWRMHPDICRFISDVVYDGRLNPEPRNAGRHLVLQPGCDSALVPSGIRFVPVNHDACSQYSDEEVERVKKIYDSLLLQSYIDGEGHKKPMTRENILVVAPYNMQVERLKRALGAEARVGTVDKFQGQEAEVVILSMATSNAETLPRNIEFLFSKNRLNVAISRAKCLSILVANPELMSIPCKTPEQMSLVNTLCWVAEIAR